MRKAVRRVVRVAFWMGVGLALTRYVRYMDKFARGGFA